MKKNLSLILFFTSATLLLSGCQKTTTPEAVAPKNDSLKIVATFYPLYDFASKVAGSSATVSTIVPAGIEPHEYEPSPREIQSVYEADLVVYNGAGIDPWMESLLPDLEEKNIPTLNTSQTVPLLEADESFSHDEELTYDPHFWLDPILVQKQVEVIRDQLIAIQPESRSVFEANAANAIQQLKALDAEFAAGLKNCSQKVAVVTHDAFQYLAARYDFDLLPISGLSPEEEPSAKTLAELTDIAKEKKIQTIFFETLASPKIARTLAEEIGADTLILNPLEGLTAEEERAGEDYISVMKKNLQNLKIAMQCQ